MSIMCIMCIMCILLFYLNFNVESVKFIYSLFQLHALRIPVTKPTYSKNQEDSSDVDLVLTNSSSNFQSSCTKETCAYVFHWKTIAVMKTTFEN